MPTPSNHRAQFIAARDSRNRRIPGLYLRGDRYYAQLWVDVGNGRKTSRRFPLRDSDNQPVQTLSPLAKRSKSSDMSAAKISCRGLGINRCSAIIARLILKKPRSNEKVPRPLPASAKR